MQISLVLRELVDLHGPNFRIEQDKFQLGLTEMEARTGVSEGFVDYGIVMYQGQEFYMSSLSRPATANIWDEDDEG